MSGAWKVAVVVLLVIIASNVARQNRDEDSRQLAQVNCIVVLDSASELCGPSAAAYCENLTTDELEDPQTSAACSRVGVSIDDEDSGYVNDDNDNDGVKNESDFAPDDAAVTSGDPDSKLVLKGVDNDDGTYKVRSPVDGASLRLTGSVDPPGAKLRVFYEGYFGVDQSVRVEGSAVVIRLRDLTSKVDNPFVIEISAPGRAKTSFRLIVFRK